MEHMEHINSTGGNSTTASPEYNPGDIGFILFSTSLVWLMIPGLGFFYSGLARSKSALSLIFLSCWSIACVSVQWFAIGYSLCFSETLGNSGFIGGFSHIFLKDVHKHPNSANTGIPDMAFCIYQGMFAAITPALAIGAAAERGRVLPTTIFIFLWTTFVYDFLACWTWNSSGWANKMGGLDFAGEAFKRDLENDLL